MGAGARARVRAGVRARVRAGTGVRACVPWRSGRSSSSAHRRPPGERRPKVFEQHCTWVG